MQSERGLGYKGDLVDYGDNCDLSSHAGKSLTKVSDVIQFTVWKDYSSATSRLYVAGVTVNIQAGCFCPGSGWGGGAERGHSRMHARNTTGLRERLGVGKGRGRDRPY